MSGYAIRYILQYVSAVPAAGSRHIRAD